ncbi:hypothetical protein CYMTET_22425 [Cymbomonas tetramitiformis]|uniref:Uncharacterized protein n=1 Tax=Cymbomonas tetramitiformis TaxID=36881 RepID=A0AAE0G083_9CHLO|nr:hypothetical protein CYMTET_22425 [Cymbomonas tetramitiformis]
MDYDSHQPVDPTASSAVQGEVDEVTGIPVLQLVYELQRKILELEKEAEIRQTDSVEEIRKLSDIRRCQLSELEETLSAIKSSSSKSCRKSSFACSKTSSEARALVTSQKFKVAFMLSKKRYNVLAGHAVAYAALHSILHWNDPQMTVCCLPAPESLEGCNRSPSAFIILPNGAASEAVARLGVATTLIFNVVDAARTVQKAVASDVT